MAVQEDLLSRTLPAEELVRQRPCSYWSYWSCPTISSQSKPRPPRRLPEYQQDPFPLPTELVHEILSYLGRDSLWDFASASTSCYAVAFPLMYSRLALGHQKHLVHLGDYDGVRETTGRYKIERKKLARFLGWQDHEELRMDLFVLEHGKETLSKVVRMVHFQSPGPSGPLVDKTFELLGSMSNLRCLSIYQPLLKPLEHREIVTDDGEPRIRTAIHSILESLAQVKTLKHLELDIRAPHNSRHPRFPDKLLAPIPSDFPNLTSLSVKLDGGSYATTWESDADFSVIFFSLLLKGLLVTSRDTLQDLQIAICAPLRLKYSPYPSSYLRRAEEDLNFRLGDLVGPQLKVLDYQAVNRQPESSTNASIDSCHPATRQTDFALVCGWFPALRELRMREEYRASVDPRRSPGSFTTSPFELATFRQNLDAASNLRDLEFLDISQRRYQDGDLETQRDYCYFASLLQSRSPVTNPLPASSSESEDEDELDKSEAEEKERLLRQVLLAQETSRALSQRLPSLKKVSWCANRSYATTRNHFCWFYVSEGKVLKAGSPGLRRRDRINYNYSRRKSEPDNSHMYLANVFGMRKLSI